MVDNNTLPLLPNRALARIVSIDTITPIPNADAIETATVGGWTVVVKKGEYTPGDYAIYLEIDSWVPHELAPFLSKGKDPREYNNVKGERLRTIKLRGQLSQGLLLPLDPSWIIRNLGAPPNAKFSDYKNRDVTNLLNIQKWEPPIPARLAGLAKGNFPSFIPKTDQPRIQNLQEELNSWKDDPRSWEVTEKLDGSSMTVYIDSTTNEFNVCSRNINLKCDSNNSFWAAAQAQNLEQCLRKENRTLTLALQGELVGEGIQGNPYKIKGQKFYVYDIYDFRNNKYLGHEARLLIVNLLGLTHVPIIDNRLYVDRCSIASLLAYAEGKSILNSEQEREGLVFKRRDGLLSFKAISNKFLLQES